MHVEQTIQTVSIKSPRRFHATIIWHIACSMSITTNDPTAGSESCRMLSMPFHSAQSPSWQSSSVSSSPGFGVTDRSGLSGSFGLFGLSCLSGRIRPKVLWSKAEGRRSDNPEHLPLPFLTPNSTFHISRVPFHIPHSSFLIPPRRALNPF
jgi:hypothetical protein